MPAAVPATPIANLRPGVLIIATALLMTAWTVPMCLIGAIPTRHARRWNAEVLARSLARMILRLWGLRLDVHHDGVFAPEQTIYVSNHSSTIDLFVLMALGLPDTRYFLKGSLRWLFPLGLIATLLGTFFTYPQSQPQKRTQCFKRAEEVLRRTGDSVYLSPEGTRVTDGTIGPFNKGAFHLATNLGAPIVPLYIKIPRAIDPGKGLAAGCGTVEVHVQPPILTGDWKLSDLETNKEAVRAVFLGLHEELSTA